jgi:hypothetical protein
MRSLGGFALSPFDPAENVAAATDHFPCLNRTVFLRQGIKLALKGTFLLFYVNKFQYVLYENTHALLYNLFR